MVEVSKLEGEVVVEIREKRMGDGKEEVVDGVGLDGEGWDDEGRG